MAVRDDEFSATFAALQAGSWLMSILAPSGAAPSSSTTADDDGSRGLGQSARRRVPWQEPLQVLFRRFFLAASCEQG